MRLRGFRWLRVEGMVSLIPFGIARETVPVCRFVVAALFATLLAFVHGQPRAPAQPARRGHAPQATPNQIEVRPLTRLESLLSAYVDDHDVIWDAFDAVAVEHLNARRQLTDGELQSWLRSLARPHSDAEHFGFHVDENAIFIVWTDYPNGARASKFSRSRSDRWEVTQTYDLRLGGSYVSLAWRKDAVLLVAGSFRTGDANRLTLVGLDVSNAVDESLRLEVLEVGSVELPDGVSVHTWVSPRSIVTHLFSHWRDVEVKVRWLPAGFTIERRELEPVVAAIDDFCQLRRDRDQRADSLVLGGNELRERLPSDCMRMTLEDISYTSHSSARVLLTGAYTCAPDDDDADGDLVGTDEIVLEMRRTRGAWRIAGIASPDRDCRPYRQQVY